MNAMADAVLGLRADAAKHAITVQSLTQAGLELRQQVTVVRSELNVGLSGANDAAQNAAMAQMAVSVEAKFDAMDNMTAELTAGMRPRHA